MVAIAASIYNPIDSRFVFNRVCIIGLGGRYHFVSDMDGICDPLSIGIKFIYYNICTILGHKQTHKGWEFLPLSPTPGFFITPKRAAGCFCCGPKVTIRHLF